MYAYAAHYDVPKQTPTRKMYMMANLTPSAEITGGPWFTDGALDADFIKQLRKCVIAFLKSKVRCRSPQLVPRRTR